jgi:1-acyl-sn-glycerol-3-phosphate acyltransferase
VRRHLLPVVKRLWAPRLSGVEHLPRDQPFLLVANHSGGMGIAELLSFIALYVTEVGPDRPLAGFAHPIGFKFGATAGLWREMGMVPSTYEAAEATLAEGVPLLVFPGGDHETLRPLWQASVVDFAGRRGFLRIARKAGVPVVPMGIAGSHHTAPMLLRSKVLAWALVLPRLMGIKRWGISLLAVLGALGIGLSGLPVAARVALGWFWVSSPLTLLPILPGRIRFRIGAPLSPEALFSDDDQDLQAALDKTEAAVQALVRES